MSIKILKDFYYCRWVFLKGDATLFSLIELYFILKTVFIYFMNMETLSSFLN